MSCKLAIALIIISFLYSCKYNSTDHIKQSTTKSADTLTTGNIDPDAKNRDIWQHPENVIRLLGDISNQTVADIGAGSGYFSFKVLPHAKKLIAIDIDERFINLMNQKAGVLPEDLKNRFEARLASPDDPRLSENEIQTALVVNTYIYIQNRTLYFKNLKKSLSNKAKLVIIDFKDIDLPVGPTTSIKLSAEQVMNELKEAGYSNITIDNSLLEYQYVVTAENTK